MNLKSKRGDQINWNHVYFFSEIAGLGSVKKAAEKLGLSPSTLSEHLSQLESDLNLKLFDREHRKLRLTAEGARLFQSARQMFETGKRFIDLVSPESLGCYPISIGIVPGTSYSVAHDFIHKYFKAHKEISANVLQFQHAELESALFETKVDFGFTDQKSDRRNIVQVEVELSEFDFYVSRSHKTEDIKALFNELPLAFCRSQRLGASTIEQILESMDLSPKNIIVSEYPSLVETLCREGVCVALLGQHHFGEDDRIRKLRSPKNFPRMTEKIYATWHKDGDNSEAIRRLKPILQSEAALVRF